MSTDRGRDLTHDFVLPTLLFAALGGMSWAVRGCSGFGGSNGCVFAGVLWGTAWWCLAREPGGVQPRRYSSGWIVLAMTVGIGIAGARGWMQWSSFFEGKLLTDYSQGKFVPISPVYGFVWLFIAGVPWAGLGACMLAWCGPKRPVPPWQWAVRIACGVGLAMAVRLLFARFPAVFLPLYESLQAQYADLKSNPNLGRLINDNRNAVAHLGMYLGFLAFEIGRRDWKNATLISTVGMVNGLGWAACQNWKWALRLWPGAEFNFWRCWESSGGICIGVAYGVAYWLVNRPTASPAGATDATASPRRYPNLERFGLALGLLVGLGMSLKNGLKGWANIYLGNEQYWDERLWRIFGPAMLVGLAAIVAWIVVRRLPRGFQGDVFPHAYGILWAVLLTQNLIAQLITGPHSVWSETAFSIYYVLLFLLSAVIVVHVQWRKRLQEAFPRG